MQIPSDVQKVNNSGTSLICQEDFFYDPESDSCRPECSKWLMYTRSAEIASLVVTGIATVIGILTTIVIIILSFVKFKSM